MRSLIAYLVATRCLEKEEAHMPCSIAAVSKIAEIMDMPNLAVSANILDFLSEYKPYCVCLLLYETRSIPAKQNCISFFTPNVPLGVKRKALRMPS